MKKFLVRIMLLALLPLTINSQGVRIIDSIELEPADSSEADIARKNKEIKQLTQNAVKHFLRTSNENACYDFIHNPIWRKGELFVFVFDKDGVCLAHGDDTFMIWKSIGDLKTIGKTTLLQEMLGIKGGKGRISYLWDNAYKSAYIEKVIKGDLTYIIGSGFFPESDEYVTKQLVKTAVAYFNKNGREATFALMSNPKGPFNKGDIYMFAYDFRGIAVAHGQNAALIGQNLIDLQDSRGKYVIRELLKIARAKGSGWLDYYWRNEFKRSYVERVVDPKTKKAYIISAGFYPNMTLKVVEGYVKRAISFLKTNGSKVAFAEFSNQVGEFARGGLGIFVFDYRGKCLANGENPSFVGQNLLKVTDQEGKFYVQEIINTAKKYGKALVSFRDFNAQAIAYVERVEVPDGKYIIGATYFPDSKIQSTQTLVNKALALMSEKRAGDAFRSFTQPGGDYQRGDLSIFVYDTKGTRLVNGTQTSQIWRNFMKTTDQAGKNAVADIISTAVNGGGWIEYKARNATRRVYSKTFEKTLESGVTKTFVVGSGYFK